MATIDIFTSFEFDKDVDLKNNFYRQANEHCPHRVGDCSLHEAYPTNEWQQRARNAISRCDLVIVLVGPDTHSAPGVAIELNIARQLRKPVFQVRPNDRPYTGVAGVDTIPWRWNRINRKIAELCG